MKKIIFLFLVAFSMNNAFAQDEYYAFKPLPYSYNALEPWIDSVTMKIHYEKHHRTYYDKFVKAMQDNKFENKPMTEIFKHISKYPDVIRNMGGGYWNHEFFWESMSGTKTEMSDKLNPKNSRIFLTINKNHRFGLFSIAQIWIFLNRGYPTNY